MSVGSNSWSGSASRRDRGAGFAMIEMMLALAIISLLAALALPWVRIGSGQGIMRFEAQRITAFLRSDRNAALQSGHVVTTRIDLKERKLESGSSPTVLTITAGLRLTSRPYDMQGFSFFADGTSNGGVLALGQRGEGMAIRVNPLTAAIQAEEF